MYGKKSTDQWQPFQTGEALIVLIQGKYNGMAGRFIRIRPDPSWADIEDPSGTVRPQPRAWLRKIDENGKILNDGRIRTGMPAYFDSTEQQV